MTKNEMWKAIEKVVDEEQRVDKVVVYESFWVLDMCDKYGYRKSEDSFVIMSSVDGVKLDNDLTAARKMFSLGSMLSIDEIPDNLSTYKERIKRTLKQQYKDYEVASSISLMYNNGVEGYTLSELYACCNYIARLLNTVIYTFGFEGMKECLLTGNFLSASKEEKLFMAENYFYKPQYMEELQDACVNLLPEYDIESLQQLSEIRSGMEKEFCKVCNKIREEHDEIVNIFKLNRYFMLVAAAMDEKINEKSSKLLWEVQGGNEKNL